MKSLGIIVGTLLMSQAALADTFYGTGYSITFDNPTLQFDGTSISKQYNFSASLAAGNTPGTSDVLFDVFFIGFKLEPGYFLKSITTNIIASGSGYSTNSSAYSAGEVFINAGTDFVQGEAVLELFTNLVDPNWLSFGGIFDKSHTETFSQSWSAPSVMGFYIEAAANGTNAQIDFNLESISIQLVAAPVPEPSSYAMLGLGMAVLGAAASRRRKR